MVVVTASNSFFKDLNATVDTAVINDVTEQPGVAVRV
jgi:hypothetical protein